MRKSAVVFGLAVKHRDLLFAWNRTIDRQYQSCLVSMNEKGAGRNGTKFIKFDRDSGFLVTRGDAFLATPFEMALLASFSGGDAPAGPSFCRPTAAPWVAMA